MRKEARLLLDKAVDSLLLSIEHFNRPWDRGRTESVLILLDHAFEMLLKAAITQKGGKIRECGAKQTLGFDACVRKALSDGKIKFLDSEQALLLQTINSLRDAAQHYLLDISEQHLYIQISAGLSLFRDLYFSVFSLELAEQFPERVLPISTQPPVDFAALFDKEVEAVRQLIQPGMRRGIEATSRLRGLAIVEAAMNGEHLQPSQADLKRLGHEIGSGSNWKDLFPTIASINLTSQGYGPSFDLRFTKKEGIPIHVVPEGTPGASVVAIKRVDELGYYNLGLYDLAKNVGLTSSKTLVMIKYLGIQNDLECYKEFVVGSTTFKRYSEKAIQKIREALCTVDIEQIWREYRPMQNKPRKRMTFYR